MFHPWTTHKSWKKCYEASPFSSIYFDWLAPGKCTIYVVAISLSLSLEGAIQAGKDGVSDATDAEDATVAAVASAGVDQASLVVVGGWWLVVGGWWLVEVEKSL